MNLYLMQHGRPLSKDEDPKRPLSQQGREEVRRVAGFLQKAGVVVGDVFHSGKLRARQTAEIVCVEMKAGFEPEEKKGLGPMDEVLPLVEDIQKGNEDLMIIGHLPHLAKVASFLVTGSETIEVVQFQQGGSVCLHTAEEEKNWRVAWMVIPQLLQV